MATTPFPVGENLSYRETLEPAMTITDGEDAAQYFEALVAYIIRESGQEREESERVARHNLGYYAGYYGHDIRARVERLYHCAHPIFGPISEGRIMTAQDALEMGKRMGEGMNNRKG